MDELERIREQEIERMRKRMDNPPQTKIKIEVSDSDFEEKVIKNSKDTPILVDFWAEWCMPCLVLGRILDKIFEEYNGKFVMAKVNVDKSPWTSQRYGIRSIPSVKIFKDGKIVSEFIGALPENQVRAHIDKSMNM